MIKHISWEKLSHEWRGFMVYIILGIILFLIIFIFCAMKVAEDVDDIIDYHENS